jgi:hypothetical protein
MRRCGAADMKFVMAGHSRPKDGVASACLCPGHPRLTFGQRLREDVDARDVWREDALRAFARA